MYTALIIVPVLVFNVFSYTHASLLITPKDCTASSEYSDSYACTNAFDGVTDSSDAGVWVTAGEGQGSWIQLNFDQKYVISLLRVQQRSSTMELSKGIQLEFSDGSTQEIELAFREYDAFIWEEFTLIPVTSMYIKLTVLSVWSTYNNGFIEIRVRRPEECRNTVPGTDYLGIVDQTRSGIPCQFWSTDDPHSRNHQSKNAANFPDETLEGATNFCRNPDGSSGKYGEFFLK